MFYIHNGNIVQLQLVFGSYRLFHSNLRFKIFDNIQFDQVFFRAMNYNTTVNK